MKIILELDGGNADDSKLASTFIAHARSESIAKFVEDHVEPEHIQGILDSTGTVLMHKACADTLIDRANRNHTCDTGHVSVSVGTVGDTARDTEGTDAPVEELTPQQRGALTRKKNAANSKRSKAAKKAWKQRNKKGNK